MTTFAIWSPMEGAPEDRPVLLANAKGDMAVAKWHSTPQTSLPKWALGAYGYWQLTGCALDFPNPIAWADLPEGPN